MRERMRERERNEVPDELKKRTVWSNFNNPIVSENMHVLEARDDDLFS